MLTITGKKNISLQALVTDKKRNFPAFQELQNTGKYFNILEALVSLDWMGLRWIGLALFVIHKIITSCNDYMML